MKLKKLNIYLILIIIIINNCYLFSQWSALGAPEGGPTLQIIQNNSNIYSLVSGSGIYESTDDGANWRKLNDQQNKFIQSKKIAFDNQFLYCLNQSNELFKTSDLGNIWIKVNINNPTEILNLYSFNNALFLTTLKGVLISTDQGSSWQPKYQIKNGKINDIYFKNNNLYVALDLGLLLFTGNIQDPEIIETKKIFYKFFDINNELFTASYDSTSGYQYYTIQNGNILQDWNHFEKSELLGFSNFNNKSAYQLIEILQDSVKYKIILSENLNDFREIYSNNFSQNQIHISDLNGGILVNSSSIFSDKGLEGIIKFNIVNPSTYNFSNNGILFKNITDLAFTNDKIYCSTSSYGLYNSSDGGINFRFSEPTIYTVVGESRYLSVLNKLGEINNKIICSTNDGIYLDIQNLNSKKISPNNIIDFYIENQYIYSISNQKVIYKIDFNTGIYSEKNISIGDFNSIFQIFKENNNIYISSNLGIYKSTNEGDNFSLLKSQGITNKEFNSILKKSNSLVVATNDGLYITENEGESWTKKLNFESNSIISFENYLFTGGRNGFYLSFDNGLSWIESNDGLKRNLISKLKTNKKQIYAVIPNEKIHINQIKNLGKIKIESINNTSFCAGDELIVSYKTSQDVVFSPNNKIFYELFDVNNHNKFYILKELITSEKNLSTSIFIPDTIPYGNNYRIRIRSNSSSEYISIDNLENISIIQSNYSKIQGPTTVCKDIETVYKIDLQSGWNYLWKIENGIIISGQNTNNVIVKFNSTGNTKIYVDKISNGTCTSKDSLVIDVKPSPEKPSIIQSNDSLITSASSNLKWYKDGNIINGETKNFLKVFDPGKYRVSIQNEWGCEIFSDELDFNPNLVKIIISSHKASAGENFELNFKVLKFKSFKELGINKINGVLSFNATLLYPENAGKDSGSVKFDDARRYINIELDTNNLDINNIIRKIPLMAMLGNNSIDTIKFEIQNPTNVMSENGLFTLNVCLDETGKPRLLSKIKKVAITNVYPNPIFDNIKINVYTYENQFLNLYITNYLGERISNLGFKYFYSGENSLDFKTYTLPAGQYFIMIESYNQLDSYSIIKR